MTRLELLQRSSAHLGRFASEVKVANAMGQFDINKVSEDFLIPIFTVALDCPDLCNQNRIRMNFPAVDLGCKTSRTSIQVTSDSSSAKVIETLKMFKSCGLETEFDHLYIYVLTEKQQSYTSKNLLGMAKKLTTSFFPSSDILDYTDISRILNDLADTQIEFINSYLEDGFRRVDTTLKFRTNMDDFLLVSHQKIENEKRTRKYIPSIFVETSEVKEEVRYFANPMFFYRKIDEDLLGIDLTHLNKLLGLSKIAPITNLVTVNTVTDLPDNMLELREYFGSHISLLEGLRKFVLPFSWYGDRADRYRPTENVTGYWNVFQFRIESCASEVVQLIEDILKKIRLTQVKIFLLTGMAGQGKTNFVCDLVENQFKVFEVPTIFIPGRLLNDHQGPNRILSYIINNRYSPEVKDIHELLSLLDSVADECKKPFIIVIDGINEVGDLDGFVSELRIFLDALSQYDFVKTIITCRNEFYDWKFADVFEPQFSDCVHRIQDLRREMSEINKACLLDAYIRHFKIEVSFSKNAADFLKNDLILLRIFSEIYEGKTIGYVQNIYKGDIFEGYLKKKIEEFPPHSIKRVLPTIYKICSRMMDNGIFSLIAIDGFDESECYIIDRLIMEDIILRREVPSTGLSSLGIENISFTYDEMRDFLLAYYTVSDTATSRPTQIQSVFDKISAWPIYEGFFRYVYILARKQKSSIVLTTCEAFDDFRKHYVNNLSLLSADIQTTEDVKRLVIILKDSKSVYDVRHVAWFLFKKKDTSELLNINILLDHIKSLNNTESENFITILFSSPSDFQRNEWIDRVTEFLNKFNKKSDDEKYELGVSELALILHFAPYAHWDEMEDTKDFFEKFQSKKIVKNAIFLCKQSVSSIVQSLLIEIEEERE